MSLATDKKAEIVNKFQTHDHDTGSARGSDRASDRENHLPYRALQDARQRPSLAPRSAPYGLEAPPPVGLSQANQSRAVSQSRRRTQPSKVKRDPCHPRPTIIRFLIFDSRARASKLAPGNRGSRRTKGSAFRRTYAVFAPLERESNVICPRVRHRKRQTDHFRDRSSCQTGARRSAHHVRRERRPRYRSQRR